MYAQCSKRSTQSQGLFSPRRNNATPKSTIIDRRQKSPAQRIAVHQRDKTTETAQHPMLQQLKRGKADTEVMQAVFIWDKDTNNWQQNNVEPLDQYQVFDEKLVPGNSPEYLEYMEYQRWQAMQPIVIPFENCRFRVQNPHDTARGGNPNNPNASKVTKLEWDATPESVDATLQDFGNVQGANEQLWLSGAGGLSYVGIDRGVDVSAQHGLYHPDSMVTILFPEAFRSGGLSTVSPSPLLTAQARINTSLEGLNGTLTPENRFWTKLCILEHCINTRTPLRILGLDGNVYALDFSNV